MGNVFAVVMREGFVRKDCLRVNNWVIGTMMEQMEAWKDINPEYGKVLHHPLPSTTFVAHSCPFGEVGGMDSEE